MLLSFAVSFPAGAALTSRADADASIKAGEEREATIAVNPTNPRNVVAFSNTVDGTGFDKTWASFDGGLTFTQANIANPAGQSGGGDPALAFDRAGNLYAAHLTTDAGGTNVSMAKSLDGGLTWGSAVLVIGTGDTDKEWIGVGPNPSNLAQDVVYILFRQDVGADVQLHSIRSTNGGAAWVNNVLFNDDSAGAGNDFATFPDPVVRKSDGALFVVWDDESNQPISSDIMIDVSLDGGITWGVDQTVGTTNVTRGNPTRYDIPAQPEREILTVPSLAIAQAGANAGRLYVSYTIENAAGQPNTDVRVARADAVAGPWTNVTVNNVTSNSQFHPWVDTDPMTGEVYVTWYDCRNDTNTGVGGDIDTDNVANTETQRFVAASINGGVSYFGNVPISDGVSNESLNNPTGHSSDYGDYNTNTAFGGAGWATWPDNSNSTGNNPGGTADKDVYVDRIVMTGHLITVTGTAGVDTYTVDMDASSTYLNIWEGAAVGTPDFIMLEDAVDGIIFNLLGSGDTVNINEIDTSMPITINGGDGGDIVNIGDGDLDNFIDSGVTVNGDAGTDRVNLDDTVDTVDDTYTIDDTTFEKNTQLGLLTYGTVEQLFVDGSPANNTFTIAGFLSTVGVTVQGNAGNDTFQQAFNDMNSNWGGNLTISGGADTDTISLNDSGDLSATEYTVSGANFGVTGGITTNLFIYGTVETFTWLTNTIAADINITSTISTCTYTVNGSNGNDTFNLGVAGGNAEGLNGDLTITGDVGTDSWFYLDSTDVFADDYTLTSTTLTRTANGLVTYGTIESGTLNCGTGNNPINVDSTLSTCPVTVNGNSGNDVLVVATAGDWDNTVLGNLTFNGNADLDTIRINDTADTVADNYTVTGTVTTKSSAASSIAYPSVETYTLDANNAANTITVTSAFTNYHVNGNGGVDLIDVVGNQAGTFLFVDSGTGLDTVNVNSDSAGWGAVQFDSSQDLALLHVFNSGTARLNAGGPKLLYTQALTLDGNGTLDLTDNDMIVDYPAATVLPTIQTQISAARNGGAWNGSGITSTTAAADPNHDTGLGAIEATDFDSVYGAGALFDGTDPDGTSVLVKYTYYGDTDFNGKVDGSDYARVDAKFNQQIVSGNIGGWFNGDEDYNGKIDGADYALIDGAFNSQGAALRPAASPPAKGNRIGAGLTT